MPFLLKICILIIVMTEYTLSEHCLSSNKSISKCDDWKRMSVLVADLVGQSTGNSKVETKSNTLTLLIRAASGVIGRGTSALKNLVVHGLVLLTQTVNFEQNIQRLFNARG